MQGGQDGLEIRRWSQSSLNRLFAPTSAQQIGIEPCDGESDEAHRARRQVQVLSLNACGTRGCASA
eukprot:5859605-Pleurochrysis_carterae.AAC.6